MTRKRMGEIALLILKAGLAGDHWDTELDDEDLEEVTQDIKISKEEFKEFWNKLSEEAYEERDRD